MFPFFETIAYTNQQFNNLDLHQFRINRTFKKFYPTQKAHNLNLILSSLNIQNSNLIKVRINYSATDFNILTQEYLALNPTQFLLYEINELNYQYKYNDRYLFNFLKSLKDKDSELLFIKNGFLTDNSYSNLCFFNGSEWFTPEHCLFQGTQRSFCINNKLIISKTIHYKELNNFTQFKLINAMNDFLNTPSYPISLINTNLHSL